MYFAYCLSAGGSGTEQAPVRPRPLLGRDGSKIRQHLFCFILPAQAREDVGVVGKNLASLGASLAARCGNLL